MAPKLLAFLALATVTAAPVSANRLPPGTPAPPGGPNTLYCLQMEILTGSIIQKVECRTRDRWAFEDINVDEEWAENGVRVEEPGAPVQQP